MKWSKALATKFIAIQQDRDNAEKTAAAARQTLMEVFAVADTESELEAAAQAEACLDGFFEAAALVPSSPTPKAIFRHPGAIQNMTLNDATGYWESNPNTVGQMWTLRFDLRKYGVVDYGKKARVAVLRKGLFPLAGTKTLRIFNDLNGPKYPNLYVGAPSDKELFLYTELLTPYDVTKNHPSIIPTIYSVGDGNEHYEVYQLQWPSDYAKADGRFQIIVDGKIAMSCDTWQCEGTGTDAAGKVTDYRGLPWDLFIQAGPSNPTFAYPPTSFMKVKDAIEIGGDW